MRLAAALAALVAATALAAVAAHWIWALVAPAPLAILPPSPAQPAAVIASAHLFGDSGASAAAAQGTPSEGADRLGEVHLLGVVAGRDGRGEALFRVPAGPVFARVGEDVVPGVALAGVAPDAVTLRDGRGEHRLALPERNATGGATGAMGNAPQGMRSAAPGAPGATQATRGAAAAVPGPAGASRTSAAVTGPNVPPPQSTACAPPPGFQGDFVRLNVELVGGLISQPEAWRSMVASDRGALVVRETAGFGQLVGLQQGDRIEQANGIPLKIPDDIVGAVLRPLSASQPVHLVGERNGQRREVYVVNAGCR